MSEPTSVVDNAQRQARRQALKDAARWHVQLSAGDGGEQLQDAWKEWLASDREHCWAWERVSTLQGRLGDFQGRGELALDVLGRSGHGNRRTLLKGLVIGGGLGLFGWSGYRIAPGQGWLADLRTATGEIRHLQLADGSQLTLDTDSAVDIRFDEQQRLLHLWRGRLLLQSADDAARRPLLVQTAQGRVQALGTRFSVMQRPGLSEVDVYQHAVRLLPEAGLPLKLEQGQRGLFDTHQAHQAQAAEPWSGHWSQGQLIVEDWPMGRLLDELARYRPGLLQHEPRLDSLRVSGTFPLTDSDAALAALEKSFPLHLERRTRYWVSIRLKPEA
ncbi:FecR domain-containing protein [Pseudomonas sp. ABC1]|uniref:FecR domain-containing protein n=1 Tax=Pseudomonas sp. ABC1 TaxID=2748080 RepID=UPI0015C31666|nr:FecR domain-containing protein [Pseudomonas sp. ABC1]QLF94001.1 FecR domain-containing protein [Pseudomonas sp. ABC1]